MMKKILVLRKILVILVILQFAIFASAARHRVYLLHPTVGNIENMMELLQQKVIEIPDLEMVGVQYHPEKSSRYLPDALYVSTPAENFRSTNNL
ncbi:MAG TPA: hypothetical protein VIK10_02695 [Prolixibacteraceae bacterium]